MNDKEIADVVVEALKSDIRVTGVKRHSNKQLRLITIWGDEVKVTLQPVAPKNNS